MRRGASRGHGFRLVVADRAGTGRDHPGERGHRGLVRAPRVSLHGPQE